MKPAVPIKCDSGGICTTLGNDSMSDSKQKSSYEHGSDFERLRSYGHFLIPVHALMCTALTELFALQALLLPADSPAQLQTVQFPYLDTWWKRGRWGGYSSGYKLIVMLRQGTVVDWFNHLTPNGHFSGRTAPLTYRCCIFYLFNRYTYWIF
jgi:hypothetical protein